MVTSNDPKDENNIAYMYFEEHWRDYVNKFTRDKEGNPIVDETVLKDLMTVYGSGFLCGLRVSYECLLIGDPDRIKLIANETDQYMRSTLK